MCENSPVILGASLLSVGCSYTGALMVPDSRKQSSNMDTNGNGNQEGGRHKKLQSFMRGGM